MGRLLVLLFVGLVGGVPSAAARPPAVPLAALAPGARVMVFAPHPDDETVGVGGLLNRLVRARVPVRVVFVTNGDGYPLAVEAEFDLRHPAREDYLALGRLRQQEAMRALGRLGLGKRDALFLGFPDGGLAELWREHWSRAHPYTSPYTKEDSPPYPHAVARDVEYDGQDLLSIVTRVIRDFRPTVVVMPHPSDTHPDHVHAGYFVTEAVSNLQADGTISRQLALLSYLVHFPSWPARRGPAFDRQLPMDEVPETHWAELELSEDELAAKRAALARYGSQLQVMHGFLRHFLCRNELFGNVSAAMLARIASMH
jgi:LmbE family N-acetylglucosaminyl deacetylase